jgi:AcrR family transcriptional regulator
LVLAASELVGKIGFEASTTADIAARAGVTQRTFYRYFSCKEDVLLEWLDSYNINICQRLSKRPVNEPPLESLRRALDAFCNMPASEVERSKSVETLTDTSWTLRARMLSKFADWEGRIAAELVMRGIAPLHADFLGAFAVSVLSVAFRTARHREDCSVEDLIDEGFEVLKGSVETRQREPNGEENNQ